MQPPQKKPKLATPKQPAKIWQHAWDVETQEQIIEIPWYDWNTCLREKVKHEFGYWKARVELENISHKNWKISILMIKRKQSKVNTYVIKSHKFLEKDRQNWEQQTMKQNQRSTK
jgi:hypothetical protein